MTVYDAEYWARRYFESMGSSVARQQLEKEVGAKWGDGLLAKMMEHWKKLADQPTRPVDGVLPSWSISPQTPNSPAFTPALKAGMTEEAHARVKRTVCRLYEVIDGWRKRAEKAEATGASPEDQFASKANGEGSIPSAPAIEFPTDHLPEGSH